MRLLLENLNLWTVFSLSLNQPPVPIERTEVSQYSEFILNPNQLAKALQLISLNCHYQLHCPQLCEPNSK